MQMIRLEEYKESPNRQWVQFDVRTKLLATLVIAQIIICGGTAPAYGYLKWAAILLPFFIVFSEGYYRSAVRYLCAYMLLHVIAMHLDMHSAVATIFIILITGFLCQFLPSMYLATHLMKTTPVREFIAAMKRMHMPDAIVIPISVMFRFIPSIGEEYQMIRRAMYMRSIASARNPIRMMEYRIVPLLMSVLNIGNELSMAAVARGLGANAKRTSVYRVRLRAWDIMLMLLLVALFIYDVYLLLL